MYLVDALFITLSMWNCEATKLLNRFRNALIHHKGFRRSKNVPSIIQFKIIPFTYMKWRQGNFSKNKKLLFGRIMSLGFVVCCTTLSFHQLRHCFYHLSDLHIFRPCITLYIRMPCIIIWQTSLLSSFGYYYLKLPNYHSKWSMFHR